MMRILITSLLAATSVLSLAQTQNGQKPAPSPSQTPAPQNAPSTAPTLKQPQDRAADIPPNHPVITVKGLCLADETPATKSTVPSTKDCTINVTKEEFDKLLKAFNPNSQAVTQAQLRQLGQAYVELLIFSEAGKAAGIQNTPAFKEVMRVLQLKTLGDLYRNDLAEKYRTPSDAEIEAYYKANEAKFQSAKLNRIYVPKNDPDPKATEAQKQAYQTKAKQVADDMQARAAKGEAADKLQKEAYTTLGITATPPSTEMTSVRHGVFPAPLDQEIFSHKAGDVFRSDDPNGFVIYHLESLQTAPLDSVKQEISREIFRKKMDDKFKELTEPVKTVYDEDYFGPPTPPAPAGLPHAPNPSK
ncbi:MAG TPA: peptidylprolyl isomerase [Candidatus Angelobacter sp.]|nr:peptidylprolyl isomerase [Candidatus Angelobacter sp.]